MLREGLGENVVREVELCAYCLSCRVSWERVLTGRSQEGRQGACAGVQCGGRAAGRRAWAHASVGVRRDEGQRRADRAGHGALCSEGLSHAVLYTIFTLFAMHCSHCLGGGECMRVGLGRAAQSRVAQDAAHRRGSRDGFLATTSEFWQLLCVACGLAPADEQHVLCPSRGERRRMARSARPCRGCPVAQARISAAAT
jgi:hypothetical protein